MDETTDKPERRNYVVAVYDCGQRFGGREEGGWWYDAGSLTRVVGTFPTEDRAYSYSRRLNAKLQSRQFGPNEGKRSYTSVASEGEFRSYVWEDTAPQGFPDRKPHYE